MTYILIIWMFSHGVSIHHVEFDNKEACERAVKAVEHEGNKHNTRPVSYSYAVCVPKR